MKEPTKSIFCIAFCLSLNWKTVIGLLLLLLFFQENVGGTDHDNGFLVDDHYQPWVELEFEFLTNTDKLKLHSNEFHVIRANFKGEKNSSYIIHLSKTHGLLQLSQSSTTGQVNDLHCVYSGSILELKSDPAINAANGLVSLSSCHHETGFEGLILLPEEQYYIKPSSFPSAAENASTGNKPIVPHKALNVNDRIDLKNKTGEGHIDVVLRPSLGDVKKAQLSQRDLDSAEDENPSDATDPPVVLNKVPLIKSRNNKPKLEVAFRSRRNRRKRPVRTTRRPGSARQTSASSSSQSRVVEIAVFTDEKLYTIWKGRYPRDTTTKMNQFVLAVVNNMNTLYKQPSMTESISFRLVHLEIQTAKPKTLKDNNGQAVRYLKSFCNYAAEKNKYNGLWDHALLLTGFDLTDGGNNGTAGIAWLSTMCLNSLSCSVIEGSTFGATFITTHEIGHSLGMEHDGSPPNGYCNANSYIMSPTTGGGKTDWSKCSMKNLKDFLAKGHNGNPSPKCLLKSGAKNGNSINFGSTKLPGQQFDAKEQCSVECKGCTPYTTSSPPYNDMCHLLFCQRRTSSYWSTIWSTHPALEGTSCGNGKMCRLGKCQ